jgi:hypothetical protein
MSYIARKMIWKRGKVPVFVRSTFGSKEFPPDEEVLVPPRLIPDALAIGVEFCDDEPVPTEPVHESEPLDPGSRLPVITEAINFIITRAEKDPAKYRKDFTAGNLPKLAVIAQVAGLKKVGSHEVRPIFESIAEAKEAAKQAQERKKAVKVTAKKTQGKVPAKDKVDESGAEDC